MCLPYSNEAVSVG